MHFSGGQAAVDSDKLDRILARHAIANCPVILHGEHVIADAAGQASAYRPRSIPVSYTHLDVYKRQAYIVARENLGETAALVAGSALLTDYVLTVACLLYTSRCV